LPSLVAEAAATAVPAEAGVGDTDSILAWQESSVRVRAPADSGLAALAARFTGLAEGPAEPGAAPDFTVSRQQGTFELRVAQPPAHLRFVSPGELMVALFAEVCAAVRVRSTATVLHGGGFLSGDQAILLAGDANAGKSTLCARAWLTGSPLLGDDHVVWHQDAGRVSAFPRLPLKIRADDTATARAVTERAGAGNVIAGRTEEGPCVCIGRGALGVVGCDEMFPVAALCFMRRGSDTALRQVSAREALALALPQVQAGPGALRIARLVSTLDARGRLFDLAIGDHAQDEALALLRRLP